MVTKRKITKKDWKTVEQFVKDELHDRETSDFRKSNEKKWKEVDRQLRMEPLQRVSVDGKPLGPGWHSEIELGEIAKVSEIISADTMRITFPAERDWFDPHIEMPESEEEDAEPRQTIADNTVRSLLAQQHQDFSFDTRVELSVKESLHHGSFVVEAEWYEDMMVMDGSKVKRIGAPVWTPLSMWNCYPDPSPRSTAQNMFYNGSMIVISYMPRHKLKMQKGDGWFPSRYKDIPEDEHQIGDDGEKRTTKHLKIITYHGDVVIDRKSSEDIYLPNSKVILANGVLVYWNSNILPYPSIIYGGYEKQDPRDPYFTSPIIKIAPRGKMASILANEYLDALHLNYEPPIVYDGNDPAFAQNGGPKIHPGASVASKGGADFKQVLIGDPDSARQGLEMILRSMQEGTGVSSIRTGVPSSDRQTAFEVNKIAQGGEVRTVDFIRKLNGALRTFLYMQHALNLKKMKEYTFYSDDMSSKDFIRVTGEDYKKVPVIHFDVVGAKGILGEEQRMMRQMQVTQFASQNPIFAPLIEPKAGPLLLAMYKDAGTKNPERFVSTGNEQEDPRLQQMQQVMEEMQAALQQAEDDNQVKMAALEQKREESLAKLEQAQEAKMADVEQKEKDRIADYSKHIQDLQIKMEMQRRELTGQFQDVLKDITHKLELFKAEQSTPVSVVQTKSAELDNDMKQIESVANQAIEKASARKKRTVKFIDDDTAEIVDEGDIE